MFFAVREMQHVVIKAVLLVPQRYATRTEIIHRARNVNKVLKKLTGYVLVGGIVFGQFQRYGQHVEAVHSHPAGAVGLFQMPAGGQRRGPLKKTYVVDSEKAALKNIGAVGIFAVDPPGEVQQQLVKDLVEEC